MFLVLLSVVFFASAFGNDDFRKIDSIYSEQSCLSAGGMCVIAQDCPEGNLADKGLCPEQQSKGVECCYGSSMKETRCEKQGGICISSSAGCNEDLVFTRATNCEKDEKCCILV